LLSTDESAPLVVSAKDNLGEKAAAGQLLLLALLSDPRWLVQAG